MLSPRHFLDAATEWRKGVWRRWLISYLVPPNSFPNDTPEQGTPTPPETMWKPQTESVVVPKASAPNDEPAPSGTTPTGSARKEDVPRKAAAIPASNGRAPQDSVSELERPMDRESDRLVEQRRTDVRARFDALSDRLLSVEDMLDSISRRFASRENLERRSEQRLLEVVENMAETCERQTQAIESSVAVMMRLEQRILRVLRDDGLDGGRRTLHTTTSTRSSGSTAPAATEPFFWDERKKSRPMQGEHLDDLDIQPSGYSIRGNLGEMSLPTVFSMLELERHTGRLIVRSEEGLLASFELVDGAVISSRLNETDLDPVHALRDALKWTTGSFWLVQSVSSVAGPPPRTIGSLLLEATRQNDEANADRNADRLM